MDTLNNKSVDSESLLTQKLEEMEAAIQKLEKRNRRLEFSVERLQKDKAITVNFLNTTIHDLETANKRLKTYQEEELKKKDITIQAQESQLKQITDAMPSSMAFVDKDFRYQLNNRSYFNWFGLDPEKLKGMHVRDLHGEDVFNTTKILMEKVFRGERISYESKLEDKNGNDIHLQFFQIPAYDINNEIMGVYIYGQDITLLKNNEAAIAEKNKELEKYIESNLQLENFAYLASHDLRSPLNNVLNFTKLLKRSTVDKLNEMEKKYLYFIDEGSSRMQQFIEDLLSYSVSTNKTVSFAEVDIQELLDKIITDISSDLDKNKAHVCCCNLPTAINGDKVLLKQLFQNLISNANKFHNKKDNPKIEVGYKDQGENHLFHVKDNGIGIDKASQRLIFGIFKRLHLKSEFEGTGIGLSTCKNAVEKHGGKIWLESDIGKGSTFFFSIPKKSNLDPNRLI